MGRMAEAQRRLLEQMMGAEAMGITQQNVDWWDEKVCRNYLFGTCPHILFGNTKMDLGICPKLHSERILKQFQEHVAANPSDPRVAAFRQEHENSLYGFVDDADRRIRAAQRKLEKTPEENRKTVDLMREIGEIELSIQGATEEMEALGEAGKVEESMQKLATVDALRGEKASKERELQELNENAGASGHQKLRVCEICGAMLSVLDSDKRLADHFGGKLHLGYQELRRLLGEFAEARMTGRNGSAAAVGPGGASSGYGPRAGAPPAGAPSGPSAPPPGPPGPSGPPPPAFAPSSRRESFLSDDRERDGRPHTPSTAPKVPPADEMPVVGHGDKVKREAGELVEDVKEDRERSTRDRSRDGERDRDKERDREERYDKYDREERRSSRYEDKERRDRKYEDDRGSRRDRSRSRSPAKRHLV
ncbi:splicing factor [Saitozyma podzolica]|uniref:Splicing factor n=1 Tax=Saitozyma podzolica TaxID=1890683 RepID=A0A427YDI8_9TREE|nr:splicing factor [Saitozyma podzolica]